MKGFVPVTKQGLFEMLADCREEVAFQVEEETNKHIIRFIEQEQERITNRRWYRLFTLPKARFAFDDDSVKAYANTIDYPMFDGNPFKYIKSDAKNSLGWITQLERVASCEQAGEPIQIDMQTFMRLSNPSNYFWARYSSFHYSIRD